MAASSNRHPLIQKLINLCLFITFCIQATGVYQIHQHGGIPLPAKWTNQLIQKQAGPDLRLQASTYKLTLNGQLHISGIQIFDTRYADPIIEADRLRIDLKPSNGPFKAPSIEDIIVTGATIYCPATHTASGTRTPILEQVSFELQPSPQQIQVNAFTAIYNQLYIRGALQWPIPSKTSSQETKPTEPQRTTTQLFDTLFTYTKLIEEKREQIGLLDQPTLLLKIKAQPDHKLHAYTRLTVDQFQHQTIQSKNISLATELELHQGQIKFLKPCIATIASIQDTQRNLAAQNLKAQITEDDWTQIFEKRWPKIEVAAQKIHTPKIQFNNPWIQILPANKPNSIHLSGSTQALDGVAQIKSHLNISNLSGTLQAQGHLDLLPLIPPKTLAPLPNIHCPTLPEYTLSIELSNNLQLEQITYTAQSSNTQLGDLTFDHAHIRGTYAKNHLNIDKLSVDRGSQYADGHLQYHHHTKQLSLAVRGSILPQDYNPITPKWWADIFKDITTQPDTTTDADYMIRVNTQTGKVPYMHGWADVQNIRYADIPVTSGSIQYKGNPRYMLLQLANATGPEATVNGDIGITLYNQNKRKPVSVRLDLHGTATTTAAQKIIGQQHANNILKPFEFSQQPNIQLKAAIFLTKAHPEYTDSTHYHIQLNTPHPAKVLQTPLNNLHFNLYTNLKELQIRDTQFTYANGNGNAQIDITQLQTPDPQLQLNLQLNDADFNRTLAQLPLPKNQPVDLPTWAADSHKNTREDGRLHTQLQLKGPLKAPLQLTGYGNLQINDKKLSAIHLLGPLSSLLQNTLFNFTTLTLEKLNTTFAYNDQTVTFQTLTIDGPQTKIEGTGTMNLPSTELNMQVKVMLFGNLTQSINPITQITKLVNPLSRILTFSLTGTPENQRWRSAYDPRNLLPNPKKN